MIVRKSNDEYSYLNLLYKSIFSICIRGCGTALSYRLIEIFNAGSIPVIISDNYPLPFNNVINWNEICIVIKENNINNINEILLEKSHNSIQLQEMQNKIKEIYLSFSTQRLKYSVFVILSERILFILSVFSIYIS